MQEYNDFCNSSIIYMWTGTALLPTEESLNLGSGYWDGSNLVWARPIETDEKKKDNQMADNKPRTFGQQRVSILASKSMLLNYVWNQLDGSFHQVINDEQCWKWRCNKLTSAKTGDEWEAVGDVPQSLLMLLELMRESRISRPYSNTE